MFLLQMMPHTVLVMVIYLFELYMVGLQIAPFDPTKKKKKKKPVAQDLAENESVDTLAEKTESLSGMYLSRCPLPVVI